VRTWQEERERVRYIASRMAEEFTNQRRFAERGWNFCRELARELSEEFMFYATGYASGAPFMHVTYYHTSRSIAHMFARWARLNYGVAQWS
jgi:hypothetical protein